MYYKWLITFADTDLHKTSQNQAAWMAQMFPINDSNFLISTMRKVSMVTSAIEIW